MALTATIYNFDVELSNVDRNVYETLSFKAAQHPSESDEYLIARLLAYCLEYRERIAFSKGLAEPVTRVQYWVGPLLPAVPSRAGRTIR